MKDILFKIIFILLLTANQCEAQAQDFYTAINQERAKRNLRPVTIDVTLETEAIAWLQKTKGLYHGNCKPKSGEKYRYEVLAKGGNPLQMWLESPSHRKIILSRKVKKIGFAIIGERACARLTD